MNGRNILIRAAWLAAIAVAPLLGGSANAQSQDPTKGMPFPAFTNKHPSDTNLSRCKEWQKSRNATESRCEPQEGPSYTATTVSVAQGKYQIQMTVYDNGWPPKVARCVVVHYPPWNDGKKVLDGPVETSCKSASVE